MPGICHRCKGQVYAAEEKRALNHSWHIDCFSCVTCGQNLDSVNMEEHRHLDEIYCTGCYRRLFATVSYGQSRQSFSAVRMYCSCCGDFNRPRKPCSSGDHNSKEIRKEGSQGKLPVGRPASSYEYF